MLGASSVITGSEQVAVGSAQWRSAVSTEVDHRSAAAGPSEIMQDVPSEAPVARTDAEREEISTILRHSVQLPIEDRRRSRRLNGT